MDQIAVVVGGSGLLARAVAMAPCSAEGAFASSTRWRARALGSALVPSAVILDVLGHQDVRMLRRYQHVTDSLRQEAADAIDRSFPVNSPVNDEAPGRKPRAT